MSQDIQMAPLAMEMMNLYRPNELSPVFLGMVANNPWPGQTSSSRGVMFAGHLGQALQIRGCNPRRCQTGVEREFGKYTFSVKFPCDAQIIKTIPKYRTRTVGSDGFKHNPMEIVVYENVESDSPNFREVGILTKPLYSTAIDSMHQHFGFRYKYNATVERAMTRGAYVPKNTIVADSPAIDEDGNYCYGIETPVALMSIPGIIEDGVVVSESYVKKISSRGFEKRVASWGKDYYPLNLYGDKDNYKPFPDVGDKIRDDGLLFALRRYDELLAPIEMRPDALEEPDFIFDKLVYGVAGATVLDITVHHDESNPGRSNPTPTGMEAQCEKYKRGTNQFYEGLLEVYRDLRKQRGNNLRITPEFQRLLVDALADQADPHKQRVTKTYRRNPLDDWRVEVAFEYDVIPSVGAKLTGCHGDKGVICAIWPDSKMPVDSDGNRAELIMDGDSTIKRMNLGRLYEQYLNAASRDVSKRVREMLGIERDLPESVEREERFRDDERLRNHPGASETLDMTYQRKQRIKDRVWQTINAAFAQAPQEVILQAYEYILGYYRICSPRMVSIMEQAYTSVEEQKRHVAEICADGVYLHLPTDNPPEATDIIRQVRQHYPPTYGPITYADGVTTVNNILIGSMYIMVLEKTGVDWSGVASAKLQHFGIPARVTNMDKYAAPGRGQPVRMLGEAEIRLFNAAVGSDVSVDLLDQSNNPTTHKEINRNLLKAEQPTNMPLVIDRNKVPLGNSRNLVFVNHIMECAGIRWVRRDDPERMGVNA